MNLSKDVEELWGVEGLKVLWTCGVEVPKSKSPSYKVPEQLDSPDGAWEGFTVKLRGYGNLMNAPFVQFNVHFCCCF